MIRMLRRLVDILMDMDKFLFLNIIRKFIMDLLFFIFFFNFILLKFEVVLIIFMILLFIKMFVVLLDVL